MLKKRHWIAALISTISLSARPLLAAEAPTKEAQPDILSPDWYTIFWVLFIFLIVVAILYKTAWKNVLTGLKAREDRIRKDIADAEAARLKGEQALVQYNAQLATAEKKVQDIISQATSDAEKLATNIRMRAQQESEEAKERATREIEATKKIALTEIYTQTANLATSIAEKIIRRTLNADDQRELVSQSIEQFQKVDQN